MFIRTHALTRGDVVIVRIVPLLRRVLLLQTGGGGVDRGLNAKLAFFNVSHRPSAHTCFAGGTIGGRWGEVVIGINAELAFN